MNILSTHDITNWRRGSWITAHNGNSYFRNSQFDPDAESIKTYLDRVELYFTANSVVAAKQVPILLSAIGSSTYTLLSDLLAPDAPKDKSLDEITAALKKHFEPKRVLIAERLHFHKRNQAMGESIADYDAANRRLATIDSRVSLYYLCRNPL